jgi:IS5 family transposase
LQESIRINSKDGQDDYVRVGTTVQEKNITFSIDAKLHKKVIIKWQQIAQNEELSLGQSNTKTLKKLSLNQRFRNHPKNKAKARKADRKIKTIAIRLIRELERNSLPNSTYQADLDLYKKGVAQKK